jgi:hypothetical protein
MLWLSIEHSIIGFYNPTQILILKIVHVATQSFMQFR